MDQNHFQNLHKQKSKNKEKIESRLINLIFNVLGLFYIYLFSFSLLRFVYSVFLCGFENDFDQGY